MRKFFSAIEFVAVDNKNQEVVCAVRRHWDWVLYFEMRTGYSEPLDVEPCMFVLMVLRSNGGWE